MREGLPPSYRMRADAHYVDALASDAPRSQQVQLAVNTIEHPGDVDEAALAPLVESIRRHGVLQPLLVQNRKGRHRLISGRHRLAAAIGAGLRQVPCVVHEVGHEDAKALAEAANLRGVPAEVPMGETLGVSSGVSPRVSMDARPSATEPAVNCVSVGALLEQSLATVMACSTALASVGSALSRAGVTELIQAEAWRASCLALAGRVLRSELTATRISTSLDRALGSSVDACSAECRVRGAAIDLSVSPRGLHATVDPQVLSALVSGSLLATLAILDGASGAHVDVTAARAGTGELTLAVAQSSAGVPAIWASRALDETWTSRPGGDLALVLLQAVKKAAALAEGECQLSSTGQGTRIQITLPGVVS